MKCVAVHGFGGPEVLKIEEREKPLIGDDEVLIRVEKTSINFADIKNRTGIKGKGTFPFIPGLDCAGTVVQTGKNVGDLKCGQRVIAFPNNGSYAEFVVANEKLTFAIPDQIDFTSAAACPTVAILSYKLLHDIARINKNESVLVHAAAGGVGTTAIQIAKLLGAGTVIGTVSNEKKADIVREAGADHVLLYENFFEQVNELTNGTGADIILDSLSGHISEESMKCLAIYGRLVHFGNSSGESGCFKTKDLHSSCRSVLGFSLGTTRKRRPELLKDAAEQILNFMVSGGLKMKVSRSFSLENVSEGHRLLESRKSTGKILLDLR